MGITGRQSEIIELALTYGFRGLELDIYDFAKRVEHRGLDHAARFIRSSQLKIGGFEVPVRWRGEEAVYKTDMEKLDAIAGYAASLDAKQCHTVVLPVSSSFPYHENFEVHRRRLGEMAAVLGNHGIRLGVGLLAAPSHRDEQQFQFIREAEPLLMLLKSVASDNVGLMLDTWNWHFAGGTRDALQALGSKGIVSVYVAEAPPDVDPNTLTDECRQLPNEQGPVDNVGVLRVVYDLGYRGPVTLAPHPRVFSGKTRDGIVQSCGAALEELWRALGLARAPRPTSSAAAAAAATDELA